MDVRELALKWAVKNAVDHGGRAVVGAVLAKIFAEAPNLKERAKEVAKIVAEVVKEVNRLSLDEQRRIMERFTYDLPRREERRGLPDLPGAEEGKVVTRFPPEPGGYIHLGNLRSALVSYMYARKYKGRFVLRFEDTNPAKPKLPYYEAIEGDLKAVGIKWDEKIYESDRFDLYYRYARELIEKGLAYVCTCTPEEMKKLREEKRFCRHREQSVEENLELWDRMLEGAFGEGEAVLRLKMPAEDWKNPAFRDPVLFRIITSVPHPRTGYRYHVYPTYNMACAVEDGLYVTHVLRGKEHNANTHIQSFIQAHIDDLHVPVFVGFGRIHVAGDTSIPMGKRYIREALKRGEIEGWGDVRVPTVRSLLNRGILPEALWAFFEEIGPKKTDIHVDMKVIYGINRKILDRRAKRYFFVPDPVEVVVEDAPAVEARVPYHPDVDMGERVYRFPEGEHRFFLWRKDVKEGEKIRLKYLYNVEVVEAGETVVARFAGTEVGKERKVQWVPAFAPIDAEVLLPSGEKIEGFMEFWGQELKRGDIVQLERVCFARVKENHGEKIVFYWTHD